MTQEEKLQRIKIKCMRVLAANAHEPHTLMATHVASLRTTIAAINGLEEMDYTSHSHQWTVHEILNAWPEELL